MDVYKYFEIRSKQNIINNNSNALHSIDYDLLHVVFIVCCWRDIKLAEPIGGMYDTHTATLAHSHRIYCSDNRWRLILHFLALSTYALVHATALMRKAYTLLNKWISLSETSSFVVHLIGYLLQYINDSFNVFQFTNDKPPYLLRATQNVCVSAVYGGCSSDRCLFVARMRTGTT